MEIVEDIFKMLLWLEVFFRSGAPARERRVSTCFFCVGLMEKHVILTSAFPIPPGHGVRGRVRVGV